MKTFLAFKIFCNCYLLLNWKEIALWNLNKFCINFMFVFEFVHRFEQNDDFLEQQNSLQKWKSTNAYCFDAFHIFLMSNRRRIFTLASQFIQNWLHGGGKLASLNCKMQIFYCWIIVCLQLQPYNSANQAKNLQVAKPELRIVGGLTVSMAFGHRQGYKVLGRESVKSLLASYRFLVWVVW